jgi:hypothetical protein
MIKIEKIIEASGRGRPKPSYLPDYKKRRLSRIMRLDRRDA